MPAHIHIDADMLNDAISMAKETYECFKDRPGYYNNTLNSHIVGKTGELACAQWAANLNIPCDQAFRDVNRKNEADLILNSGDGRKLRIEVKTWSSHSWQLLGRCVSVAQMSQVRAKADIVIWCTVTPLRDLLLKKYGVAVIKGWNKPTEVALIKPTLTGWPGQRQVHNHQVPMEQMRLLDQLVARLRGEA